MKAVGRLLLHHLVLSFDSSWLLLVLQLNTSGRKLIFTQKHPSLSPTNCIRFKIDEEARSTRVDSTVPTGPSKDLSKAPSEEVARESPVAAAGRPPAPVGLHQSLRQPGVGSADVQKADSEFP